jgi:hypothetical protein
MAPIATSNGERDDLLAGESNSITAWRRMRELATQYSHLRNVQRVLQGEVTYDPDGQYSEFYDGVRAVWPTAGTSFHGEPPWPTSPAARLKWLATSGHRIWLPTAAQRADRWLKYTATSSSSDERSAGAGRCAGRMTPRGVPHRRLRKRRTER